MSLIYFHILLISSAIVFALWFGQWEFSAYFNTHQILDLASGIGSLVISILLGIYFVWFIKKKFPTMGK